MPWRLQSTSRLNGLGRRRFTVSGLALALAGSGSGMPLGALTGHDRP